MRGLTLPPGFSWLAKTGNGVACRDDATGKQIHISGCMVACCTPASLQNELCRAIMMYRVEQAAERIFAECGGDRDIFDRRRADRFAELHAAEAMDELVRLAA